MDDFSQNPYLMYALLNRQQGNHYFNQMMGYNPYFTGSYANDYNSFANIEYLKPQYTNYNFGLKDVLLTHMGFHRKLGMNGMDADIAASNQHALTLNNIGITAGSTAAQVAAMGIGSMGGGIVAGLAIDWAAKKYRGNRDETYKLMQKANILTSSMIQNGRLDTGLNSNEIKGIEKYTRKLAVKDDYFSSTDLMDMMNQFNKVGMLNDVSSATQFKQTMKMLKDRVKDLAEFLGETNPSKLFQDLARYRFLGFSRKQSFDIMKSMDVASDLSGMNMKTLEKTIGMISTSQNPLGIDTRILTRQGITVANGLNTLQRMPGSYTFMSNNQQALTNMLQTNTQAEQALHHYFNQDSNKDIFLAKYMSKDNGLSTQKNLNRILKMSTEERNKYVSKYSSEYSDFSQIYNNPTLLSTSVKEMKDVGGLHSDRLAIQRLIDMAIKSAPGRDRTDYDRMVQKMGGFSSDQMLYVDKLVNNRMKFGGWSFMDDMQKVANSKIKTKEVYNTFKKYDTQDSIRYKLATAYRGAVNWLTEEWGGSTGENVAADSIDSANAFKQKIYNEKYAYYQKASRFYKDTGSKSYKDYISKLKRYAFKDGKAVDSDAFHENIKKAYLDSMHGHSIGSNIENVGNYIDQKNNLDKDLYAAKELAKNSPLHKKLGKQLEYQAQKQVLQKEVHNNAEYFKRAFDLNNKYQVDSDERLQSSFIENPFTRLAKYAMRSSFSSDLGDKDSLIYKKNFGFDTKMLDNKKLGRFITDRGTLGAYQARAIEQYGIMAHKESGKDFSKKDMKALEERMPVTSAYFEWQQNGGTGTFKDYAKEHKINYNTRTLDFAKTIYNKYGDKGNLYIELLKAAQSGNRTKAKNIINSGILDGETIKKAVDLSGADTQTKKELLAATVADKLNVVGKFKGHEDQLEAVKAFSASIDNIKDKSLKRKLTKALSEGKSKNEIETIIEHSGLSSNKKEALANQYLNAVNAGKDVGVKAKDIYKAGEGGLSKDAHQIVSNLKDLYGLSNIDNKTFLNSLSGQNDAESFKKINELRKKQGEKALSYQDFKSVERLSNVGSTLGLDQKGMEEFKKMSSLSSSDKATVMAKNLRDINNHAVKMIDLLKTIEENTG